MANNITQCDRSIDDWLGFLASVHKKKKNQVPLGKAVETVARLCVWVAAAKHAANFERWLDSPAYRTLACSGKDSGKEGACLLPFVLAVPCIDRLDLTREKRAFGLVGDEPNPGGSPVGGTQGPRTTCVWDTPRESPDPRILEFWGRRNFSKSETKILGRKNGCKCSGKV